MDELHGDSTGKFRRVTLSDGTPAKVRPIRADGGPKLTQALRNLSPSARYQRFLHSKQSFSEKELEYLTQCDGVTHLALVLLITDERGQEIEPVAVARCIRDAQECSLAEVAITVADEWQGKGVGKFLFQALAEEALAVGITHWQALLLHSNAAAFKLLETVGTKHSQRWEAGGTTLVVYELRA